MTPFEYDLEKFNKVFLDLDAVRVTNEGFVWIDADVVPDDVIRAYRLLLGLGSVAGAL